MSRIYMFHAQVAPFFELGSGYVKLTLITCVPGSLEQVWLRVEPDNEEWLIPMDLLQGQGDRQRWTATLPLSEDKPQTLYAFKAVSGEGQLWLDARGVSTRLPLTERFFRYVAAFQPPDWIPQQVFYQIFPERFCNGDDSLTVKDGEYQFRNKGPVTRRAWGQPIDPATANQEFFGGDLVGVKNKLEYLQQLGITALYLNPVFTSPSVHKYDCEDFLNVDPHLGGNSALIELVKALHHRGMKILLDAVFNHSSDTHPWFNRWQTHPDTGAYQGPESPYRDFYLFHDDTDPESYHCWKGSKIIPVLDFSNPEVTDYFYRADDSVLRHWLRAPYQIDGWRMDVIHMMGEGKGAANNAAHVRAMRAVVKAENPHAFYLGEHFYEATRWLQGDQEDGAMNYYGFAVPVRAFLAGLDVNYHPNRISAGEFADWLSDARSRVPFANQLCQLNLLDSHDTSRFLTMVGGHLPTMKLAVTLLFTYPGVPCVYYGDEVGMTGENDPYNRACMIWEKDGWNSELLDFYREMARLRQSLTTFQYGCYLDLYAHQDGFAFARLDATQCCVVAVNRSREQGFALSLTALHQQFELDDWQYLYGGTGPLAHDSGVVVPPGGIRILSARIR